MTSGFPKAVLYTFEGSVWGSVPRLCLVEKGYSPNDLEVRSVNVLEAENFAPTYLRVNEKGTVPSLVVPLAETTEQEVDTKFRAINDSVQIAEFLDTSRSQQILDAKGQENANPAPVLSPATIEGKALSDALIKLVHSPKIDPNALLLAARSEQELVSQRQGLQGTFCRNRYEALQRYQTEAKSNSSGENPRTTAMNEQLIAWYTNKQEEIAPLTNAYVDKDAASGQNFVAASSVLWNSVANGLTQIEGSLKLPFALGDQLSLADLHLMAWLARVLFVAQLVEGESDEIQALSKALQNNILKDNRDAQKGVGENLVRYWKAIKERPSFQHVYGEGLH